MLESYNTSLAVNIKRNRIAVCVCSLRHGLVKTEFDFFRNLNTLRLYDLKP